MASNSHESTEYKAIAHVNEVDIGVAGNKYVPNSRPHAGFSEQLEMDEWDESQNVHKLSPFDQLMERMNNLWVWESAAVVVSLVALALSVWLLIYLDGTKLLLWKARIKPNALLAIFMTAAKSCILVAIAAGVAQLKWVHFGSAPRNLDELDLFDSAGRGPWGAFRFLSTLDVSQGRAKLVASVGAIVTIVALAMDPFAQQLLSYEVKSNPQPALSNQTWVSAVMSHDSGTTLFQSNNLRKALYGGLLQVDYPVGYSCGSGNCTWDPFVSLGSYGRCEDVAATLNQTCLAGAGVLHQNCTQLVYTIPSYNLSIVLQNGSATDTEGQLRHTLTKGVTGVLDPLTAQSPVQFQFVIAQLLIDIDNSANLINTTQLQIPSWNITACSIEWSAKVYSGVQVSNSTFSEPSPEVLEIISSSSGPCVDNTTQQCRNFEVVDRSRLPKGEENVVFSIDFDDGKTTVRDLLNFDTNITSQSDSSTLNGQEAYSVIATLFWNTNMTDVVSRVTTAYTNYLRSAQDSLQVSGTAWADETYIQVKWAWFSLPAVLVLSSAAFLIAVIIMSRMRGADSEPYWKASTLPLLLHGVGWSNRREYHKAESNISLNSVTRGAKAQLTRNHRGEAKFVKVS